MTPEERAAIEARDAAWVRGELPQATVQTAADRRALLAKLREMT